MKWAPKSSKIDGKHERYLHFNRLIPIYYVSTQCKRFNINYMDVTLICSNVKPFASNRQIKACNSICGTRKKIERENQRKSEKVEFSMKNDEEEFCRILIKNVSVNKVRRWWEPTTTKKYDRKFRNRKAFSHACISFTLSWLHYKRWSNKMKWKKHTKETENKWYLRVF